MYNFLFQFNNDENMSCSEFNYSLNEHRLIGFSLFFFYFVLTTWNLFIRRLIN